jgi:two-component system sensor histidine kinase and response regulator WspE
MSDDLSGFSLMDLFRSEAESHTATLSTGLLALEGGGVSTPATVEPMMRAAHSLKGAARIVGLEPAVQVAHVMEDCFVAVQKGKVTLRPPHVDILLRGVDLLTQISQLPEDQISQWAVENETLVAGMIAEIRSVLTGEGNVDGAPSQPPAAEAPPTEPGRVARPESSTGVEGATAATTTPVEDSGRATRPPSGVSPTGSVEDVPGEAPGGWDRVFETPETGASAPGSRRLDPSHPDAIESGPEETPSGATPTTQEAADRVVRVTAESLTRLMSLAGESLVQSHHLRPFVDSLLAIRNQQSALTSTIQTLMDRGLDHKPADSARDLELLSRAKDHANRCISALGETAEAFDDFARRSEDLAGRLHHEVLSSRMRPLADGIRGFPRLVRDVSRRLGKQAQFEVVGENTGVDRDILEKLESPLNHLIRNALDHAIEPPEERAAAGKPEAGRIRLEARHRAGMLQIALSDDGRGIDPERLRAKVVERGLTAPDMARQLTGAELLEFLFLPGFSTKEAVTEISGRGVGLDVVQAMVRAVGGVVRVSSQVGQGTRFTLQLPISMSVIRALLVRIAGEPYAFPLNRIDRILTLDPESIESLEGRQHFPMDGQPVGLVEARQVLDLPAAGSTPEALSVVVASDRSHRFGVVVDEFLGERDLEVRPLDPRLGKVPNVNSASVLDDGWPVLIVDVEDLVRSVDNMLGGRRLRKVTGHAEAHGARGPRRVLVVDDSITVRELERQLLESHGYAVEVAVDGVDGWNAVRSAEYHLVVSDVDMPRMDGIELVTRIKHDERLRSVPVVIVSYKDREEDRMRGLDAGANAYLTKSSFHDRTFLSTVVDLIGEASG